MALRRMRMLSGGAVRFLEVEEGSTASSMIGIHWNAVTAYLAGDGEPLAALVGVSVNGFVFETDPDVIEVLYQSGELSFEDIYEVS